jgi:hypothetical protein
MPELAATEAATPVAFGATVATVLIVGVTDEPVTVMSFVAWLLRVPAALISRHVSVNVPAELTSYVIELTLPFVTPEVPPGLVMVPFVIVHR